MADREAEEEPDEDKKRARNDEGADAPVGVIGADDKEREAEEDVDEAALYGDFEEQPRKRAHMLRTSQNVAEET